MTNKAHAAVVRRLSQRYGASSAKSNEFDVHVGDLTIEVETSATLGVGLQKLLKATGRRFIAVTNREAINDALAITETTDVGVMDPWGEIVRDSRSS
jgi:hypothetical protein